ncbi:MAG: Vi polysaccharide biosynthesis protein VipB/TviC [Candidatus Riflebacteria bacterium RBG_13_59_9]|nr:MAG: Vi polysaccharide biosynthesis protein VipB/TviC [Candidatus Riflebacteria bacterium RBG_13_59_9]
MAHYLVTGGAGFIGSNLTRHLLEAGETVRIVDNLSTGKPENLAPIRSDVEFIEDTICDTDVCRRVAAGMDFVLHQAALGSVPRSVADPQASNQANITGTLNMLVAARDAGVERFVCAGSSSVYGDTVQLPKVETMTPRPLSPYGVTKLAKEHYCRVFWQVYGMPTIVLRYFNVYGPRQDPQSMYAAVIPRFARALLRSEKAVIYGDGLQTRDFTFIEDCIQANLLACTAPKAANGEAFNIAFGEQVTIRAVFDILRELLGVEAEPEYTGPRPGDVRDSLADTAKARRLLGYEPRNDIRTGLAKTSDWYREHLA